MYTYILPFSLSYLKGSALSASGLRVFIYLYVYV